MKTVEQWLEENPEATFPGTTAAYILHNVRRWIREEDEKTKKIKALAEQYVDSCCTWMSTDWCAARKAYIAGYMERDGEKQ